MAYSNIRNHTKCNKGQFELAEMEKDFRRLLPYPCQMYVWGVKYPQDLQKIAKIASHMHGYTHRLRESYTTSHPKPHALCGDKCNTIDEWIKKTYHTLLVRNLQSIAERKPQMLL